MVQKLNQVTEFKVIHDIPIQGYNPGGTTVYLKYGSNRSLQQIKSWRWTRADWFRTAPSTADCRRHCSGHGRQSHRQIQTSSLPPPQAQEAAPHPFPRLLLLLLLRRRQRQAEPASHPQPAPPAVAARQLGPIRRRGGGGWCRCWRGWGCCQAEE